MALSKSGQQKAAFVFGLVFIAVSLGIAVFVPNPTPFQYTVFRIVLALACAGVAAMIPGFLNVEVGTAVRATGAIAVFVVVYFFSPAALPSPTPENKSLAIEYKRYVKQTHDRNREIITEAHKGLSKADARTEPIAEELQQLDTTKTALDENIAAGEQMGAAKNRSLYNEIIRKLKKMDTGKKMDTEISVPLRFERLDEVAVDYEKLKSKPHTDS